MRRGASLVGLLESFESQWGHVLAGGRIDAGALPALTLTMELGREGVEWRLEGGRNLEGGVQLWARTRAARRSRGRFATRC
ncbi:MAG: hypothetical protein M5U09_05125 [Gammaproteobacteria bacterium]|nr:hypothetical protein [Gammaproteobacteria bacterium]